jgi:2-hydroxychromene-2-carboxylate isomerase
MVEVVHFSDPGCPWAYSASPALAVLRWRYGSQLRWRHVMIGLTERPEQYVERGYTPAGSALGYARFRRYGMPFAPQPRARVIATSPECRAVVAVRLRQPERELAAFRALQFAWFTTPLLLDERDSLRAVLGTVEGVDGDAAVDSLDDPRVVEAYEEDRAEARRAAGSPTELQGKSAATDGPVRYTAPSLVLRNGEARLEAGGFQPVEAYDVVIANLDTSLRRAAPAEDPVACSRRAPSASRRARSRPS